MPAETDLRPLALTMGDPAGVGLIASLACWLECGRATPPFYLLAPAKAVETARAYAGLDVPIVEISAPSEAASAFPRALPVLTHACLVAAAGSRPGHPEAASAPAIVGSIEMAVDHVLSGQASAVVTNPIAKALLAGAGFPHPGHTEFLAELANQHTGLAASPVMMLAGGGLRVALATIHLPLAKVPAAITGERIERTASILHADLRSRFGITSPRIGTCGLNPHAGEAGILGREEIDTINPACARLRAKGVDISDARPADTIFHEMLDGRFDAIMAMYHDQGLAPLKTLDLWGGVNITLGLPFIRTSPDHGTGLDAALSGRVKHQSLRAAIELAAQMARAEAGQR